MTFTIINAISTITSYCNTFYEYILASMSKIQQTIIVDKQTFRGDTVHRNNLTSISPFVNHQP